LYADSLGFLNMPGLPPVADPDLSKHLNLIHLTAAPPTLKKGSEIVAAVKQFNAQVQDQTCLSLVTSARQVRTQAGKTKVVLGLQAAPYDCTSTHLEELWKAGVRVMAIGYADPDHPLGAGFANPNHGLTPAGRQYLRELSRRGFVLDLSHSSHQAARDALKQINAERLPLPVMASHGGCYAVYPHLRNLPSDVLLGIADLGGVIGLYTLTFGLHEVDNSHASFFTHFNYLLKTVGHMAMAVGSDAVYRRLDPEE
jgi:microsomal dipeptidase-like Zn-dependent dipeptidase